AQLQAANHPVNYIAQEGMNHVYPIYPIEEAKTAQYQMIDIINKTP
ncbi:esterase, partial [Streptococcus sp. SPC0]|nr:esterase [Streptococcus sp. SPC0]